MAAFPFNLWHREYRRNTLLRRIRECCVLETKNKILKHLIQTLTLTHAKETRKIPIFDGKASGRGGCRCGAGAAAPSGAGGWAAPGRVPLGSAHVAVGAAHRGRPAGSVGCSARRCRRLPPRALRAATCLTGGAGKRSQHSGSGGRALRGAPPSFPGASPAADGRLGAQNEEWAPKRMSALEADGEARGGQASRILWSHPGSTVRGSRLEDLTVPSAPSTFATEEDYSGTQQYGMVLWQQSPWSSLDP
ncbi:uncharacterized protein [Chlorocebus sabaeus]|uniref:uncharacterized protein n=1 Tax=Chlorocebus sabaeus TaxID=60711 RepID=UPI003BF9FEBE